MRIVLQQKENGLYLKDLDAWTRSSSEAMDFASSTVAIDYCQAHKLSGLQIVLKFDREKYEIVLPALMSALAVDRAHPARARLGV